MYAWVWLRGHPQIVLGFQGLQQARLAAFLLSLSSWILHPIELAGFPLLSCPSPPSRTRGRACGTMTKHVDQNWQRIQQTTFTNWVNNALRGHLKTSKNQVKDLQTDLQDGLVLIQLIGTIASPRNVGHYNRNPAIKIQKLENLGAFFRFLHKEKIKLVNIGELRLN